MTPGTPAAHIAASPMAATLGDLRRSAIIEIDVSDLCALHRVLEGQAEGRDLDLARDLAIAIEDALGLDLR